MYIYIVIFQSVYMHSVIRNCFPFRFHDLFEGCNTLCQDKVRMEPSGSQPSLPVFLHTVNTQQESFRNRRVGCYQFIEVTVFFTIQTLWNLGRCTAFSHNLWSISIGKCHVKYNRRCVKLHKMLVILLLGLFSKPT